MDTTDDTLRICLEKIDFLAPDRVTDDTSVLTIKGLVFEPLCRWDKGLVRPALFSEWRHTPDGREWEFQIRPGAVFHDGKPCVADDVLAFLAAILRSVDTFGMPWSYARYLKDARFSAAAPNVVRMTNPEPLADIVDIFSEFYLCRLDAAGAPLLGTGPYRVADWTRGASAALERVRASSADGAGPRRIVLDACRDADERYRRLQDGLCDVALNLERMHGAIDYAARFQWFKELNTLSVIDYLDCAGGLFASGAARRAVNHAVDVQAIIDTLFQGLGRPAATVVSPWHLGWREAGVAPIPYDPDLARALLDEAGAGTGGDTTREIVIRTPLGMPEKALEMSRMIQHDLARVGIAARLDVEPDRPEYARQVGRKQIGDMAIFDSSPHSTYRILDDKIASRVKGIWWQGHHDDTLESLIVQANRSIGDAARAAAYGRCLARLNANPPWLYLFHPIELMAARHGLHGLRLTPKGTLELTT